MGVGNGIDAAARGWFDFAEEIEKLSRERERGWWLRNWRNFSSTRESPLKGGGAAFNSALISRLRSSSSSPVAFPPPSLPLSIFWKQQWSRSVPICFLNLTGFPLSLSPCYQMMGAAKKIRPRAKCYKMTWRMLNCNKPLASSHYQAFSGTIHYFWWCTYIKKCVVLLSFEPSYLVFPWWV